MSIEVEPKKIELEQFAYFEKIGNLRNQNIVPILPSCYVFASQAVSQRRFHTSSCKNEKPADALV